jgi:hypothetical protein
MIRRLFRQFGAMTVASFAWKHRGTVLRAVDLAKRAPTLVRDGRTDELKTEARALVALDSAVPTDTTVRISGVDSGTVSLRGEPAGAAAEAARRALVSVPAISDVRTDDRGQPTAAQLYDDVRV